MNEISSSFIFSFRFFPLCSFFPPCYLYEKDLRRNLWRPKAFPTHVGEKKRALLFYWTWEHLRDNSFPLELYLFISVCLYICICKEYLGAETSPGTSVLISLFLWYCAGCFLFEELEALAMKELFRTVSGGEALHSIQHMKETRERRHHWGARMSRNASGQAIGEA